MNPQTLSTRVIAAKVYHYLEVYDSMLRNKIISGLTKGFKLGFVGVGKSHFHLTFCLLGHAPGSLIQRWHQKWHSAVLLAHSSPFL